MTSGAWWLSVLFALVLSPGLAVAGTAQPLSRTHPAASSYLPADVDIVALLPPPPARGSARAAQDLSAVLEAQRSASPAELAHAEADSHASCARFDDVLGAALSASTDVAVLSFLDRAAREGSGLIRPAKRYWHRTRPYALNARIVPRADVREGSGGSVKESHSSYPSGHSTYGTVCAILLADMVPEQRARLFARAEDFGYSRLVVGAHFPSDVAAGRLAGTVAVALMMQNPTFQQAFTQARRQLRAQLHLSDKAQATGTVP